MRFYVLVMSWLSAISAGLCLTRLGFNKWPVVLTYERWEYVLKVALNGAIALWGFWAVYGVFR